MSYVQINIKYKQANILEHGLALHGRLVPPSVQPLHNRLLECFAELKTTIQQPDFCSIGLSPQIGVCGQKGDRSRSPLSRSNSGNRIGDSFRKNSSTSSIVQYVLNTFFIMLIQI